MTVTFSGATMTSLWRDLNFRIEPGEFVAILGPNGVGKSTLLAAIMGTRPLDSGRITVDGRIGLIPQQRMFPRDLPLRGRDLVSLAIAHGILRHRRAAQDDVERLLAEVGATQFADEKVGVLSGGQQQLLRQAQAFAGDPAVLLCDEPLLSLDYAASAATVARLDRRRKELGTSVLFVTHSINPILDVTDKVVYLGPKGHMIGTVEEVMTSENLSRLYNTQVDVARVGGKLVVI